MATLFSKLVSEIDITRILSIPANACAMGRLNFEENVLMDMHVEDDCGKMWMFGCWIQKNDDGGCALCVDWLEFVRHKDVRVGDKVLLIEEIEDQAMRRKIKIEVKRKIRLFGQDIWADVK